ncbi:MAG TPA: AAA family ATPase, partial [Chloroflexota bacterium]
MRIAKIVLNNVKSYAGHTTIDLAPGINAICGENGAGKSTILESIGYTLFGYRPYKLEAFLREGEKSGSVSVTVEDENGCSFDVVRKLGSSGGQAVYDELGQRIAEGDADVRRWLADFFHLEAGTDLGKLFEDAVGPPQGTLTAIFLESGAVRKQKFDRLLGIEDYRTAADGLRAIANVFRDGAAEADARAAVLEGTANRLPGVEERQGELVKRQAELGQELRGLLGRQEALAADRDRLEKAKQQRAAAEAQLSLARARAEEAARRKTDLAEQMARAEEAARIVEENRPGYAAFREASDRLRQLNGRRVERDELRQRVEVAARTALSWEQQVRAASEQIDALDRDTAAAVEMEARVPEQDTREQALRRAEQQLHAREDARRQLDASEQRLASAEARRVEAERRLAEIEEARPLAAELAGLREREKALLSDRARLAGQIEQLSKDAGNLASSKARLEQVSAEVDQLVRQIDALRPLEMLVAECESRQRDRDGAASAVASLEGQHTEAVRTRAQVEGGLCPFFHERCKNLREGVSLDAHFDGVVASTSAGLASAAQLLSTAEAALAESRSAEREFSRLPDLQRHLEQLTDSKAKLEQEVERFSRARSDLAAIPREE